MALTFNSAQSEHLRDDTALATSFPFAIGGWFYQSNTTANCIIMFVGDKDNAANWVALWTRGADAGDYIWAWTHNYGGGSSASAASTTGFSANTWHHGLALFVSTADRRIYLDGGSYAQDTTSVAGQDPSLNDRIAIGGALDSTPSNYHVGQIAECAIWDLSGWTGATDSDKADNFGAFAAPLLAAGYSPLLVPGITNYWPIRGDASISSSGAIIDYVGGTDLTRQNTPTQQTSHPPMITKYPAMLSGAAGGGGGGGPTYQPRPGVGFPGGVYIV